MASVLGDVLKLWLALFLFQTDSKVNQNPKKKNQILLSFGGLHPEKPRFA